MKIYAKLQRLLETSTQLVRHSTIPETKFICYVLRCRKKSKIISNKLKKMWRSKANIYYNTLIIVGVFVSREFFILYACIQQNLLSLTKKKCKT